MIRILDANVLITAKNWYYAFDVVPVFWDWIDDEAAKGTIASTDMVYDDLKNGGDDLAAWVKARRASMFHMDSTAAEVATKIAEQGTWIQSVGFKPHVHAEYMACADPFIVGVAAAGSHCVVTLEAADPNRRKKVKIPDACKALGVTYENTFQMLKALGAKFTA